MSGDIDTLSFNRHQCATHRCQHGHSETVRGFVLLCVKPVKYFRSLPGLFFWINVIAWHGVPDMH